MTVKYQKSARFGDAGIFWSAIYLFVVLVEFMLFDVQIYWYDKSLYVGPLSTFDIGVSKDFKGF